MSLWDYIYDGLYGMRDGRADLDLLPVVAARACRERRPRPRCVCVCVQGAEGQEAADEPEARPGRAAREQERDALGDGDPDDVRRELGVLFCRVEEGVG